MFSTYLELGFEHILDIQGYDHIVFVIALCALFPIKEWKRLLILVTAFTLGHSLTLALAVLEQVKFNREVIEFLIPVTIFFTAIMNVARPEASQRKAYMHYIAASFFGLIHGLGFSNYLKSILFQDDSVVLPLFAFNLGVELGQIVIVLIMLAISFLVMRLAGVKHRSWMLFISGAAAGIAIILMIDAKFW